MTTAEVLTAITDWLHFFAELFEALTDLALHDCLDGALAILGALARDPGRIAAVLELASGSDIEVVAEVMPR